VKGFHFGPCPKLKSAFYFFGCKPKKKKLLGFIRVLPRKSVSNALFFRVHSVLSVKLCYEVKIEKHVDDNI